MVARSLQPCDCDVRQAPCKCRVTDDKTSQIDIVFQAWLQDRVDIAEHFFAKLPAPVVSDDECQSAVNTQK
jgi:hypothetical protein